MKDPALIDSLLTRGKSAEEKAEKLFEGVTHDRFNHQPAAGSWSAAQCLEHLMISHSSYFKQLEAIRLETFVMSRWARISPFSGIFGYSLRKSLDANSTRKFKTHPKLKPLATPRGLDLIQTYNGTFSRFLDYVGNFRYVELDEVILTSPVASFVTYKLRDALTFLIEHEHRHLNQAERAMDDL